MSKLFDQQNFIGHVSSVNAAQTKISFPNIQLARKFYYNGSILHGGIVRNYVVIEGEEHGFLGRITGISIAEKERRDFSEFELRKQYSAYERTGFQPIADIEILLAFSIFEPIVIQKGLEQYPPIGARAFACSPDNLREFFEEFGKKDDEIEPIMLELARLPHDNQYSLNVSATALFGRHCAIVGTTGSGKSWTVGKLLELLKGTTKTKIVLIDPTGEYKKIPGKKCSFGQGGDTYFDYTKLTEGDLFAMFRPSGQVQAPAMQDAIRDLKLAKVLQTKNIKSEFLQNGIITKVNNLKQNYRTLIENYGGDIDADNADFNIKLLSKQIGEECIYPSAGFGKDETRFGDQSATSLGHAHSLMMRIESRIFRGSFAMVFGLNMDSKLSTDIDSVLNTFFSEKNDEQLLLIDVANVPSDESLRAVLLNCIGRSFLRRALESNSFEKDPAVLCVDEAHLIFQKEVIKDEFSKEFQLDSFGRIAKETRKKGLFLCLATQRPRDIPPDVLSQMGSFITHRLINENDRNSIESASPEGSRNTFSFLPGLGRGEAIIVGVDFPMPAHVRIIPPSDEFKPDSKTPSLLKKS